MIVFRKLRLVILYLTLSYFFEIRFPEFEKNSNPQKLVSDEIGFSSECAYTICKRRKNSEIAEIGGLKWTRTTDLTLIRRAL